MQIAASFGKSLYFNTYGGNPLASTVGKAVLEVLLAGKRQKRAHHKYFHVIEEEKLQENCAVVGAHFMKVGGRQKGAHRK